MELTCRQERYAQRCVGIARFVYNRMVANDQAGRDADLWLTPHELEKEFNAANTPEQHSGTSRPEPIKAPGAATAPGTLP